MQPTPLPEHDWLMQLIGEWTYQSTSMFGPDGSEIRSTGTEIVRSVGPLWIVGELEADMPGFGPMTCITTLGYDPAQGEYVGNWIGSPMTHMFVYRGSRDESGRVLTLDCTGPSMHDEKVQANYQDVMELAGPNERGFESRMQEADGSWTTIMQGMFTRAE